MSAKNTSKRPHGQIRQSQVITTFGPGAMLDLPESLGAGCRPRLLVPAWVRKSPSRGLPRS